MVPIYLLYACGGSVSPTVTVEIMMPRTANQIPVASMGAGQSVGCSGIITINGSKDDDDNPPLTYLWLQNPGTAVTLIGTSTATVTLIASGYASALTFNLIANGDIIRNDEIAKVVFTVKCPNIPATEDDQSLYYRTEDPDLIFHASRSASLLGNINRDEVDKLFVTGPCVGKKTDTLCAISRTEHQNVGMRNGTADQAVDLSDLVTKKVFGALSALR